MAAEPNIGAMHRTIYVLGGVATALWGVFGADADWARLLAMFAGGALVVEGLIGY